MRMGKRLLLRFSLLGVLALAAGCASQVGSTTQGGTLGVNRVQKLAGNSQQYNQQAQQQYRQVLQEAQQKGLLNRNPAQLQRVRNIAQRLIAQVGVFRPDAQSWAWEVNTLEDADVNAWCMPGGKIAVYSGLINTIAPSDDELAAVIGHEIAHALREHAREQALRDQQIALASILVGAALKSEEAMKTTGRIGQIGYGFKYSRGAESEADLMGLELAARAGYDPRAAISLWRKMAANGQRPPEFLSTHPDPANREAALAQAAQKLLPIYEQAKRGSAQPAPAAAKKRRRS
ncbi:MAG: M48 family peptidase [Cellvibrionales bacterium]|nr:MAG: M48 family peptidase [Cellvibrionales bacterium]